jgi:hypothetical protein
VRQGTNGLEVLDAGAIRQRQTGRCSACGHMGLLHPGCMSRAMVAMQWPTLALRRSSAPVRAHEHRAMYYTGSRGPGVPALMKRTASSSEYRSSNINHLTTSASGGRCDSLTQLTGTRALGKSLSDQQKWLSEPQVSDWQWLCLSGPLPSRDHCFFVPHAGWLAVARVSGPIRAASEPDPGLPQISG